MDRHPVESSAIVSVGYDAGASTLEVEFRNGHVYQYHDVPKDVVDDLLHAPSRGTYMNTVIKQRGFRVERTR